MGNSYSCFSKSPGHEDVISFSPNFTQMMDDLFLVVENPDDLEQNSPYPMSLRTFPPSFWQYSVGDNFKSHSRQNSCNEPAYIQQNGLNMRPPATRSFSEPMCSHAAPNGVYQRLKPSINSHMDAPNPIFFQGEISAEGEIWKDNNKHLSAAWNSVPDQKSEFCSSIINLDKSQIWFGSNAENTYYDCQDTVRLEVTGNSGVSMGQFETMPENEKQNDDKVNTSRPYSDHMAERKSGFGLHGSTNPNTASFSGGSQEVYESFVDSPFCRQLYLDMQIQNTQVNSQVSLGRTSNIAPQATKYSSSLPNPPTATSDLYIPSWPTRFTEPEGQYALLKKEVQAHKNQPKELTNSHEAIRITLDEVEDMVERPRLDNNLMQMNFSDNETTTEKKSRPNNRFLLIPEPSHSKQSSGDSGVGSNCDFDLTDMLDTQPITSDDEIPAECKID